MFDVSFLLKFPSLFGTPECINREREGGEGGVGRRAQQNNVSFPLYLRNITTTLSGSGWR